MMIKAALLLSIFQLISTQSDDVDADADQCLLLNSWWPDVFSTDCCQDTSHTVCNLNGSLVSIIVENQTLGDQFPKDLILPDLQVLVLRNTLLSGEIPNLNSMPNINHLDISQNLFVGQVSNLPSSLKYLDLSSNTGLNGSLPPSLSALTFLGVSNTSLNGALPSLPNLESCKLANDNNICKVQGNNYGKCNVSTFKGTFIIIKTAREQQMSTPLAPAPKE